VNDVVLFVFKEQKLRATTIIRPEKDDALISDVNLSVRTANVFADTATEDSMFVSTSNDKIITSKLASLKASVYLVLFSKATWSDLKMGSISALQFSSEPVSSSKLAQNPS